MYAVFKKRCWFERTWNPVGDRDRYFQVSERKEKTKRNGIEQNKERIWDVYDISIGKKGIQST